MVARTMEGEIALVRACCSADAASGVEMLVREGVLIRHGSHTVRWMHNWVREYAIVDHLVAGIDSPGLRCLLDAITEIPIDHVARSAATGGAKWVHAHPEWGTLQAYLVELSKRRPGHASEVLADLILGNAELLDLAALPPLVLIEAVHQATLLKARQWQKQIAELPLDLFAADVGPRLHEVALQYDVEMNR
jgi:hypothetical protein